MPLTDAIHDLCETRRAVCVSEKAIVRVHTMHLSKRSLPNPALLIKGRSGLVMKESTHTTDVEHPRLSPRSGRRLMSYLSEYSFSSHSQSPSIILH